MPDIILILVFCVIGYVVLAALITVVRRIPPRRERYYPMSPVPPRYTEPPHAKDELVRRRTEKLNEELHILDCVPLSEDERQAARREAHRKYLHDLSRLLK